MDSSNEENGPAIEEPLGRGKDGVSSRGGGKLTWEYLETKGEF